MCHPSMTLMSRLLFSLPKPLNSKRMIPRAYRTFLLHTHTPTHPHTHTPLPSHVLNVHAPALHTIVDSVCGVCSVCGVYCFFACGVCGVGGAWRCGMKMSQGKQPKS
jgi:hypothetical protein